MRPIMLITTALLFATPSAHGAPITWVYEAEVGYLNGSFNFDVAMDDRVSGSITFDAVVILSRQTKTKTELLDSGRKPDQFHPFMDEVSSVATAYADDADSILEIVFTLTARLS